MFKQTRYEEIYKLTPTKIIKPSLVQSHQIETERVAAKLQIDDFELGPNVGKGNFGIIYLAFMRSESNNKVSLAKQTAYALKVICKDRIETMRHAEHVIREKQLHLKLSKEHSNPFIVKALNSFQDD